MKPPNPVTMEELAMRCEGATGADREIDWHIQKLLGIGRWPDIEMWPPFMVGSAADKEVPRYTASLDAAMSLVDPTWFFHVSRFSPEADGRGQAHIYPNRRLGDDYEAEAATPALALTAAALRARATEGEMR